MTDAPVLVDTSQPVWRATLNRPQHGNACSPALVEALDTVVTRAKDEGAQALVLQGTGRHFCTGFDLSSLDCETDDSLLSRFVRIELLLQRIAHAPFLTIAHAHGRTMGAGADLFAACRVRLAQANAMFAFPGGRGFGLVLGTRRLAERVGAESALEWIESGRSVTAEEALRRGLVTSLADGPHDIQTCIAQRCHLDAGLRESLDHALQPLRADHAARDLDLLVRSAARPGLRERIAAYVARLASDAQKPAPHRGGSSKPGAREGE